jgi:hypothetical protein
MTQQEAETQFRAELSALLKKWDATIEVVRYRGNTELVAYLCNYHEFGLGSILDGDVA